MASFLLRKPHLLRENMEYNAGSYTMIKKNSLKRFDRTDDELLEFFVFSFFCQGLDTFHSRKMFNYFQEKYVLVFSDSFTENIIEYIEDLTKEEIKKDLSDIGFCDVSKCFPKRLLNIYSKVLNSKTKFSLDIRKMSKQDLVEKFCMSIREADFFLKNTREPN